MQQSPRPKDTDMRRRELVARLSVWPTVAWFAAMGSSWCQTGSKQRETDSERMRRAEEEEARQIEILYSTKPIRVILGNREFRIPANYFGTKQRDEPDTFVAGASGFGFNLFLPDYGGFTKENWRQNWFHPDLVKVTQLTAVDKQALVLGTDGKKHRLVPANWGDPVAKYQNAKNLFEETPAFKMYALEGYRRRGGGGTPGVLWTGHRSNGEFFFFESSLGPGDHPLPGRYSSCSTQYYSKKEDLFIAYRYPQSHIERWREIDDAIWSKVRAWRVK